MNVVGYLHHADLLLEDEQGMAIIGGGNYVLSVGDKVSLKRILDQNKKLYLVDISFASNNHNGTYEDQCVLKFEGCRDAFNQYLSTSTVH
ncbi:MULTISPECIES: hypothetical protein [Acinetobacter]|jgi:hypothetical protein|uniref:Uncharacterized protein n=3 Tax=Acinetobacter schindleri TaxID=108981 RepID=N9AMB0_9GAMM|nr:MULTISPECIES: hypothetical protein [Acinetobacter]AWD68881.1 hypothetical protein C0119_00480 [Acinetobacter schindleri]ENV12789.1 hypothetical protein F965_02155 [Acinetobacter schindleri NIPH 900]ENV44850.1 hypothetical protein F955_01643 [Acinetobacter schindleri CIP 107287]MCU4322576.1 hypothetical protein [Acinetobacter schindleri]MCU4519338.1 hypothetical protein [Acinetobacter schindleri]